jgi:hypothetical protein
MNPTDIANAVTETIAQSLMAIFTPQAQAYQRAAAALAAGTAFAVANLQSQITNAAQAGDDTYVANAWINTRAALWTWARTNA